MKKKLALIMAALLCSATVATALVGCGEQPANTDTSAVASETASTASETPAATTVTLAEVRAANDVATVLNDHTAITMETTYTDADDKVTAVFTSQYVKNAEDKTCTFQTISADGNENPVFSSEITLAVDNTSAMHTVFYGENKEVVQKLLTIVPVNEIGDYVNQLQNPFHEGHDDEETEVDCVPQDDVLVLQTACAAVDEDSYTYKNFYYVDPVTKLVKSIAVDAYDKDGKLMSTTLTTYTYDAPVEMDVDAEAYICGDKATDKAKLTANINVAGAPEGIKDVQEFTIAKDTQVGIYTTADQTATIYTELKDDEPSNPVETIDMSKGDTEVYFVIETK